jgi:hypothetical protein
VTEDRKRFLVFVSRSSRVAAIIALCLGALVPGASGRPSGWQSPAPGDLLTRVGLTLDEAAQARSGKPAVRVLTPNATSEIALAGAIRIRGNLERLVAWLHDIEDFRKAIGVEAVGTLSRPARPEDFAALPDTAVDLEALQRCRPGACEIRMPAAFLMRFSSEVPWGSPKAQEVTGRLARQLLAEYATAYQKGGDKALGAHHDQKDPNAIATTFQDMFRRATQVWNLAHPFASYLETFPSGRPADVDDRFYWTRESGARQPVTTLHHVVIQRLPDKSLRLADKQIYASRDIDAGLLVGQATPTPDGTSFDLVVALRARTSRLESTGARVLRSRIEREVADTFGMYLDWLQRNFALG